MSSPFGSWPSPFTAASVAASAPRIDGARFAGDDIWWGESVPAEGGRVTVRSSTGAEILPSPWNARSRVHEYGGGAWTTDGDALYFVSADDQRVYRLQPGEEPRPLTAAGPAHGGLRVQRGRLLAVREDLSLEPHRRAIVEIPIDGSAAEDDALVRVIAEGPGFFAHPALSPDGTRVAWVEWAADSMPWESAQLAIGALADGAVHRVATSAALQPEWASDTELVFADDASGRWQLQRLTLDGVYPAGAPRALTETDADTGYGLWVLGNRWFQLLDDGRVVAVRTNGRDEVQLLAADGDSTTVELPGDGHLSVEQAQGSRVLISGDGSTVESGLWCVDLDASSVQTVVGGTPADQRWMPGAQQIVVEGSHGAVHAFAYPPASPEAAAPAGELPPYVVLVHGGPTAHVTGAASAAIAFFTSRGIGVLDVNYGGSTGYGRAYRDRLQGQWGVVDVDDVIAAARGLADAGLADPARIAIRGGSAGGWTVLSALVRGGTFAAGISRYGVSDLRLLAAETHDFEAPYLDGLVGPLPEAEDIYIERSPLTHADRIDVPVLLLQGADDRVVPPSQSEAIRDALAANGVDHEYVLYPGEGHGFRRAENIVDALERELAFLGRVFGFAPSA
ncbi:prolyl oligopeptidase family serine peptidase [Microbacterium sp. p3-SID336]|uniref:S9 family peptidase n=1 Tax=Microbacterium sp. p3-SID336 TaxID=2916212 RepID=UPI0021A837BB|nr:prolyl oligopeptidase family serine peptidase [Microbacterium sp. p3-SID336]MCT1477502.1 prolyl oligopeptidase family serine peptidase [Microbacterium sp. p3-SID336]